RLEESGVGGVGLVAETVGDVLEVAGLPVGAGEPGRTVPRPARRPREVAPGEQDVAHVRDDAEATGSRIRPSARRPRLAVRVRDAVVVVDEVDGARSAHRAGAGGGGMGERGDGVGRVAVLADDPSLALRLDAILEDIRLLTDVVVASCPGREVVKVLRTH